MPTDNGGDLELRFLAAINSFADEEVAGNNRPSVATCRASTLARESSTTYTSEESQVVLRKLDQRLIPFMALLYCLSFLDRSNIGNARIAGLADDLSLSSRQYEWLLWAFYITYIAFEWMTLMYQLFPPHIYISICILCWGIAASLQAVATSFTFLLILRAVLGIGEAAFGPGVPFYLSFFYQRHELALRTGLFISASPLSASFAGLIAFFITAASRDGPISPWRLLFLLEGFPSVLVAVWAWDLIPDGPGDVKWLNPRQREVAVFRLQEDRQEHARLRDSGKNWREKFESKMKIAEVVETLRDPKCYLTAIMFFSCNVAFSSMPVFLPTIIRDMQYDAITAQSLSAPPYLVAFLVVITTAYWSDQLRNRSYFVALHSILATLGYGTLAMCGYYRVTNVSIRYFALFPAVAGFFSAITIIITWTINNQRTNSQKGTGMVVLNIIGQLGPLVGTTIFPDSEGPFYVKGMSICALSMFLVGIMGIILRITLVRANRDELEPISVEYTRIPLEEGDLCSKDWTRFEYML